MSRNEKDYSSYLAYESFANQVLAIFAGFTFTAITILLTLLPDPSQIIAQTVLFFLAFVFYLFQFILSYMLYYLVYCVRDVPPEARGRGAVLVLWLLGFSLWGVVIVLMFFLWNLVWLTLTSGILYMLFTVLTLTLVWKPLLEYGKRLRPQKQG